MNMKRGLLLGFIIVLVAGGLSLYYSTKTNEMDSEAEIGLPMVEADNMTTSDNMMKEENLDPKMFSLMDVDGNQVSLGELKGKKVYVKFWASWCSICLAGIDEMDQFSGEMNDFEVLTIVSPDFNGEQKEVDFINWYQGLELENMKTLLDPEGKVTMAYGVRAYPTSVFIDTEGNVVKTVPGHMSKESIIKIMSEIESL